MKRFLIFGKEGGLRVMATAHAAGTDGMKGKMEWWKG
jgi:hypothetical protein